MSSSPDTAGCFYHTHPILVYELDPVVTFSSYPCSPMIPNKHTILRVNIISDTTVQSSSHLI